MQIDYQPSTSQPSIRIHQTVTNLLKQEGVFSFTISLWHYRMKKPIGLVDDMEAKYEWEAGTTPGI